MEYLSRLKKGESLSTVFYILPAFLPLLLFWIWPMINSVYISFTDWDYMSPDYNFVGLGNHFDLFSDPGFYKVLGNTIYFSIGIVIPTIIGGLGLALLLRNNLTGAGVYRTILFSPWITPTVAISIVWSWIFEPRYGFANWILSLVGFPKLEWTHSSKYAMVAIIIVTAWKGLGWAMIFYLSVLKKVPNELYEAADKVEIENIPAK